MCEQRREQIASHLDVLRRVGGAKSVRPELARATLALARVANAGVHPPAWAPALCGRVWRPVFVAEPKALKQAAAAEVLQREGAGFPVEAVSSEQGHFLERDAQLCFAAGGHVESTRRLLGGAVRLAWLGTYEMRGRSTVSLVVPAAAELAWRRPPHLRTAGPLGLWAQEQSRGRLILAAASPEDSLRRRQIDSSLTGF